VTQPHSILLFVLSKVKVKVKLSLCLTKHHAIKTVEVYLRTLLTLALEEGERSASCPSHKFNKQVLRSCQVFNNFSAQISLLLLILKCMLH
jgi:hypothetical protein